MAVTAVACSALSLAACWAEDPKSSSDAKTAAPAAVAESTPEASTAAPAAAEKQVAEAPAPAVVAEAKPAADAPAAAETKVPEPAVAAPAPDAASAPSAEAPAAAPEAKVVAEAAPAAAPAAAAPAVETAEVIAPNPVNDFSKTIDGVEFKEGRYRNKDGEPVPVVTKDYQVDWATWQGFRRYHDACHVCHGPNALGSTFAPSLADSLKTMDYATFYGTVVGGRVAERGGTTYVMPAFGEDKNIMCYLDDIYTYIKARSTEAMPPGRPNGREDISQYAKKAAAECNP
ncbi:MAG: c-type cytochrome, methanol metabolism-related [Hyphomicrobium sp.]|nr:c-type cytochrome, methanol metabolism-related [Hyphomicrobium sp.]